MEHLRLNSAILLCIIVEEVTQLQGITHKLLICLMVRHELLRHHHESLDLVTCYPVLQDSCPVDCYLMIDAIIYISYYASVNERSCHNSERMRAVCKRRFSLPKYRAVRGKETAIPVLVYEIALLNETHLIILPSVLPCEPYPVPVYGVSHIQRLRVIRIAIVYLSCLRIVQLHPFLGLACPYLRHAALVRLERCHELHIVQVLLIRQFHVKGLLQSRVVSGIDILEGIIVKSATTAYLRDKGTERHPIPAANHRDIPETRVAHTRFKNEIVRINILRPRVFAPCVSITIAVTLVQDSESSDNHIEGAEFIYLVYPVLVVVGLQSYCKQLAILLLILVDGVADRLVLLLDKNTDNGVDHSLELIGLNRDLSGLGEILTHGDLPLDTILADLYYVAPLVAIAEAHSPCPLLTELAHILPYLPRLVIQLHVLLRSLERTLAVRDGVQFPVARFLSYQLVACIHRCRFMLHKNPHPLSGCWSIFTQKKKRTSTLCPSPFRIAWLALLAGAPARLSWFRFLTSHNVLI